jgi:recombination protein RecT
MSNLEVKKPKFSALISSEKYQQLIYNTLGDSERAKRFVAAISSAVANNPALQACEANTIITGALLGESLNLSPSPQLGQYYLVPFKNKGKNGQPDTFNAQFVLGYKGYIQLALRSGQYRKLNVVELKEGELKHYDPLNENIEYELIQDYEQREAAPTTGYYAMFEYLNGFRKILYMSKAEMLSYADKHSPAFNKTLYEKKLRGELTEIEMRKTSSPWYANFDDMAKKTMLRRLISKWGIMSTEMIMAIESDKEEMPIADDTNVPYAPEAIEETQEVNLNDV